MWNNFARPSAVAQDVDDQACVRAEKAALRSELLQRLKQQPAEERRQQSQRIAEQVMRLQEFQRAKTILGYSALASEVDPAAILREALAQGKRVALPRVMAEEQRLAAYAIRDLQRDVEPGPHGVLQPALAQASRVPLDAMDLILVPGVGFDAAGRRLGRGRGYYDRLLHAVPVTTARVGLAFTCQMVECVPTTNNDVQVTRVISA